MITPASLYLLIKLDAVKSLLSIFTMMSVALAVIFVVAFLITAAVGVDPSEKLTREFSAKIKKPSFLVAGFALLMALFSSLVPSTKEMAAIMVVPKICNAIVADSSLMRIPSQIISLASAWLEELKPGKK